MNTQANIGSGYIQTWLVREALKNLEPNLYFAQMGRSPDVVDGFGTLAWFRPNQLTVTPAQATLVEGVTPEDTNFGVATVSATPSQYGLVVTLTDKLLKTAPTPVMSHAMESIGYNMARIIDQVIQTEANAGTNVIFGGDATVRSGIDANDVLTADKLRKAAIKLRGYNAQPFDIDSCYVAITHPFVAGDVRGESNGAWLEFSKYATPEKLFRGETGRLHGVRIVESQNVQTFASTVTVYPTLVLGKDAYGIADWKKLETFMVLPEATDSDPLAQRGKVGAKVMFAAKRLQENAMVRIESAAGSY